MPRGSLIAGFAWVGVPLTFIMSILFAYLLFVRADMAPEAITGRWYIPPVATIVVPLILAPLMPGDTPDIARTLLLVSYAFWGMGFVLYLHITTTIHHRLVGRAPPGPSLAPTWAIGLGPVAVGAIALVKMAGAGLREDNSIGSVLSSSYEHGYQAKDGHCGL